MSFRPGRFMTIFVLIFLPITLSLGVWQLNRGEEKHRFIEQMAIATSSNIQTFQPQTQYSVGQTVSMCVEWSGQQWFFDNRTYEGRVGYDLYLPVRVCASQTPVLLRLGWIEGTRSRSQLPSVPNLTDWQSPVDITAQVRPSPGIPMLSAPAEAISDDVWRVQSMADLPVSDWQQGVLVAQLLTPESSVLVDQWDPVAVPPERHLAYAIQWFGLASVLVIGFGFWGFQRGRPSEE